jgi:triacylglycerol lipase
VSPNALDLFVERDVVAELLDVLDNGPLPDGDRRAAYVCAALSAWSYSSVQTLCDVGFRLGFGEKSLCYPLSVHNSALFVDTDAFFLRSQDGRLGVLAFRGTELDRPTDLLTDIDVVGVPYPEGRGQVHAGFLASIAPLRDRIRSLTTNSATKVEHLLVTGHSLGGALAVLGALHVMCSGPGKSPLCGAYTFGQPMVGDAEFAQWANDQLGGLLHRYIYKRDLVPCLPPWTTGDFAHFGHVHRVIDGHFQDAGEEQEQAWSALLAVGVGMLGFFGKRLGLPPECVARWTPPLPFSLNDHMPQGYVTATRNSVVENLVFP